MRCPYCTTEIADEALACPHCTRDLYLFKPLLGKLAALEQQIADQAQQIAALQSGVASAASAAAQSEPMRPVPSSLSKHFTRDLLMGGLLCLAALLFAHWLLLFVYDARPVSLRITTLLLPLPVAALLGWRHPGAFWKLFGSGGVLGVAAVVGMLGLTAAIDQVPLWPQTPRDWQETLEYMAGIALAFGAAAQCGLFAFSHQHPGVMPPSRLMRLIWRIFMPDQKGITGLEHAAKRIQDFASTTAPLATGATAAYVGLKSVIGG